MPKPIIFVVDDEPDSLWKVQQELTRRYGADYAVHTETAPVAALSRLEKLRDDGHEVAIIFGDLYMPEMEGVDFLARAHEILPHSKRAILVPLGDISCAGTLLQALTFGQADDYITKPFNTPDEQFHRAVSILLEEWAQAHRPQFQLMRIVGERWSTRSFELRDMMERDGIPGMFYDADSPEGCHLLEAAELTRDDLPVVVLYNARVLANPNNAELAEAIGVSTHPDDELYDLAIVGAGPAGLSAAVYGASEGLNTVVIEPESPGGQAGTSSMVRNYLGFPRGISGGDLMRQAYRQAWLFQTRFIFSRTAVGLSTDGSTHIITLSNGERVRARSVLLSVGITYKKLNIPGHERLVGAGVYYGTAVSEAQAMRDKDVYIVGAGNSAGQAATHLAKFARRVTILMRGASLAESMSDYLIQEIAAIPHITVRPYIEVVDILGKDRLEKLVLRDLITDQNEEVEAAAIFILIGGVPHTAWLTQTVRCDEQSYIITGRDLIDGEPTLEEWPLDRSPLPLETSIPGVFAAGDVRHGAEKRIAAAVGEGSIAIRCVHEYLAEQQKVPA
ncbi:MAG TPA: FAD-dependent oxidoreductase [Chloroflexi bacterium]|jgi:thioredoxin reductase (NADPH)|nr:FAD-dependent oxidoreductase [Chloroflexota bacterium]